MSFAQLEKTILEEASAQADRIKHKYDKRLSKEESRIKKRAQEVEGEIIDQAEEEGTSQVKRLHQEAQLKAKADILRAKQVELINLENMLREEILGWDQDKSQNLINALLKLVPKNAPGEVVAGDKHIAIVKDLAPKRGLDVSEDTLPEEGGFIYRGPKSEINVTTSHLVGQLLQKYRAELAGSLFG